MAELEVKSTKVVCSGVNRNGENCNNFAKNKACNGKLYCRFHVDQGNGVQPEVKKKAQERCTAQTQENSRCTKGANYMFDGKFVCGIHKNKLTACCGNQSTTPLQKITRPNNPAFIEAEKQWLAVQKWSEERDIPSGDVLIKKVKSTIDPDKVRYVMVDTRANERVVKPK